MGQWFCYMYKPAATGEDELIDRSTIGDQKSPLKSLKLKIVGLKKDKHFFYL